MDKALFIGTSGAKESMHQLGIIANNLANANTTGFRADFVALKQLPIHQNGLQTRVYSTEDKSYSDFNYGPVITTGRDLDAAISGAGFFAVQAKSGKEGYTRAGNFHIEDGVLKTPEGNLVLGTNGVIKTGPAQRISIGSDGTIMAQLPGSSDLVTINRLKLTNPATTSLLKGPDGLFYLGENAAGAKQDDKVRIIPGSLEGSNVNTVVALSELIDLSRNFEMHTNLMKALQEDATKANQVMQVVR